MEMTTMNAVPWVCAGICAAACLADGPSFAVDLALGLSTAAAIENLK